MGVVVDGGLVVVYKRETDTATTSRLTATCCSATTCCHTTTCCLVRVESSAAPMCISSQYFADSLLLTAIAPLALQGAAQRLDYLSSRCATLPASSLSRMRGGGGQRWLQPLAHGLPSEGAQQEAPPHNVRRFRLSDDFLSDRNAHRGSAKNGCKDAVGAVGVVGSGAVHADADALPQQDSGGGARWSSSGSVQVDALGSVQVDALDWALLLEAAFAVYRDLGDGCSERTYQKKLYYDLYCLGIPCIIERPVHTTTHHGMTLGKGRVDLEVARRFVLELKVTRATDENVRRDKRQLQRYLTTYQEQGLQLERAALVYFSNNEVRIVEVSTAPRARNTFVPRKTAAGGSA